MAMAPTEIAPFSQKPIEIAETETRHAVVDVTDAWNRLTKRICR